MRGAHFQPAANNKRLLFVHGTFSVSAQTEPARLVIAGVDGGFLPVALEGQTATAGQPPLQAIQLGISGIVKIEADQPLKIEADRPLLVEPVSCPPSARPGE